MRMLGDHRWLNSVPLLSGLKIMNKFYVLFLSANKCCFDPSFLYKAKGCFLVFITITPNCYDENSLPNYHTSFSLKKKNFFGHLGGGGRVGEAQTLSHPSPIHLRKQVHMYQSSHSNTNVFNFERRF